MAQCCGTYFTGLVPLGACLDVDRYNVENAPILLLTDLVPISICQDWFQMSMVANVKLSRCSHITRLEISASSACVKPGQGSLEKYQCFYVIFPCFHLLCSDGSQSMMYFRVFVDTGAAPGF